MSSWIIGEVGVVSLSAATPAGVPIDPAAVVLRVKDPSATVTDYAYGVAAELIRDAIGEYHMHIEFDAVGKWAWRWEVGTPDGVVEGAVSIKRSIVLP